MNIFRAKHDNVPESPVRTLYGRKGSVLLLPLDICILQIVNEREEFRPSPEDARLIAAPIMDELHGRIGLIAQYTWPPRNGDPVNPVVTVQLAPSASVKGVEDLRVIACQAEAGDAILCVESSVEGVILRSAERCTYPDLTHEVQAYPVEFRGHVARRTHGAAVRLATGELLGMLIATQNQNNGTCRALVYPT
ncbi:MAG: hypothetical protein H7Z41_17555 [Cytophagales bacterium]|nr:hypothetical protein [Armatimonadota bacterium]